MKKIYTFALLCLFLAALPRAARAADVIIVDGVAYTLADGVAAVAGYQADYVSAGATITGSVTIPVSISYNGDSYDVTTIEPYAYYQQNGLLSVDCKAHITSVGEYAFNYCQYLEEFYIYEETVPTTVHNAFAHVGELTTDSSNTLYVPVGMKNDYYYATGWNNFLNIKELSSDPAEADFTIIFDPGEGETVYSVSEVYVSREDGIYFDLEGGLLPSAILTIRDTDGQTVATATEAKEVYDEDYIIAPVGYAFTLDTTLDAAGTYTIVIAANTAMLFYGGGDTYVYNEDEVTSTFFIGATPYTYTVDPASGTAVTSLSQISVLCETGMTLSNLFDIRDVIVYNSARVEVTTINEIGAIYDPDASVYAPDTGEILVLEQELTEEDTYNVIIPAKFFIFFDADGNDYYSPRLSLYYTVSEDGVAPSDYELTFDPPTGSTIESLTTLTISYDGGIVCETFASDADIVVYSGATEVAYAQDVEEVADSRGVITTVIITFSTPITTPGTYNVVIDEGYFRIGSTANETIVLTYTIVEDYYALLCDALAATEEALAATWQTITTDYPEAVDELADSYAALVDALAALAETIDEQYADGITSDDYAADSSALAAIDNEIAALLQQAQAIHEGISTVATDGSGARATVYTLAGQRVAAPTAPGVYVINGKKVLK